MKTYNTFYTVKDGIEEDHVTRLTHEFVQLLIDNQIIDSAYVNKVVNKGNFEGMPSFHLAVNFRDQKHMDEAFTVIRHSFMNQTPHRELMSSVVDFKVTFTECSER